MWGERRRQNLGSSTGEEELKSDAKLAKLADFHDFISHTPQVRMIVLTLGESVADPHTVPRSC